MMLRHEDRRKDHEKFASEQVSKSNEDHSSNTKSYYSETILDRTYLVI